jgi:hypothetical protein
MTMDEARRVSDLLVTLDDAKEFRESFEEENEQNYIAFENVMSASNIQANGTRGGWQGLIRMPRATAIAMMKWLEEHVRAELSAMQVR